MTFSKFYHCCYGYGHFLFLRFYLIMSVFLFIFLDLIKNMYPYDRDSSTDINNELYEKFSCPECL